MMSGVLPHPVNAPRRPKYRDITTLSLGPSLVLALPVTRRMQCRRRPFTGLIYTSDWRAAHEDASSTLLGDMFALSTGFCARLSTLIRWNRQMMKDTGRSGGMHDGLPAQSAWRATQWTNHSPLPALSLPPSQNDATLRGTLELSFKPQLLPASLIPSVQNGGTMHIRLSRTKLARFASSTILLVRGLLFLWHAFPAMLDGATLCLTKPSLLTGPESDVRLVRRQSTKQP